MRIFIASVLLVFLLPAACARQPEHCWVCQREIHSSVRAVLALENGKNVTACCPRCALHYQEEPGNRVRSITVTDYAGGGSLPLREAYLVEGSDETPCAHHHGPMADASGQPMQVCYDRCMPSLIAFRDAGEARSFMAEHGGKLFEPGTLPDIAPAQR